MSHGSGPHWTKRIIITLLIGGFVTLVVVALDPSAQYAAKRNEERATHVATLMDAVQRVYGEQDRALTGVLSSIDTDPTTVQYIVNGSSTMQCGGICGGELVAETACTADLSGVIGGALNALPIDPRVEADTTGYYINMHSSVLTIGACNPEPERNNVVPTIRVSR